MTSAKRPKRVPGQVVACGWCGRSIELRTTGRIPKWCSEVCRHRAWEQRRAVASGRSAVEVVDRVITVEVEKPVQVVKHVEVPIAPKRGDWADLLVELAKQIDKGRVYDRDFPELAKGLKEVMTALGRREGWLHLMRRSRWHQPSSDRVFRLSD
jgi:hypothetical protein